MKGKDGLTKPGYWSEKEVDGTCSLAQKIGRARHVRSEAEHGAAGPCSSTGWLALFFSLLFSSLLFSTLLFSSLLASLFFRFSSFFSLLRLFSPFASFSLPFFPSEPV